MNSKVLRALRRSVAVTVLAGGFMAAGAGVACADSEWPERDPDPKPISAPADEPVLISAPDGPSSQMPEPKNPKPIKAPERGLLGPLTISGAAAGNDAALTVTTDDASAVVSGRAHLEPPANPVAGEVVHHDRDTGSLLGSGRGVNVGTDQFGLVGGATGDASSLDVVGTGRVGREKRYYIQPVPGPDRSSSNPADAASSLLGGPNALTGVPRVGVNPVGPRAIVPMLNDGPSKGYSAGGDTAGRVPGNSG